MLLCPFGIQGFGDRPLSFGVLDSFVRSVCLVLLLSLDGLLLSVLELGVVGFLMDVLNQI